VRGFRVEKGEAESLSVWSKPKRTEEAPVE